MDSQPAASTGRKTSRRTAALEVPDAQVFEPTMEEFADFPKFVASIEAKNAHLAGIVKIRPPKEWTPRKIGYNPQDFPFAIKKPIEQKFKSVGKRLGCYQTTCLGKTKKTLPEYKVMATSKEYEAPPHNGDYDKLERLYWKSLRMGKTEESQWPIYGADVSESIIDPEISAFNIGRLDSILNMVKEETGELYKGVNSPYLYFGMWKATFSWHVEDMDFYAINFLHHGAPKSWYCVPPKYGHLLEKACTELFPDVAKVCTNFMRHKSCLVEPKLLDAMGVPYQKVVQEERDIILVFPYAYHSGFNHGWNVAESTNFAFERWVEYGKYYRPCDCDTRGVRINMDPFVKKFQPERYEEWIAGRDIQPHPEDTPERRKEVLERIKDPLGYASRIQLERVKQEEGQDDYFIEDYEASDGNKYSFNPSKMKLTDEEFQSRMSLNERVRFENWKSEREQVEILIFQHISLLHLKVGVIKDSMKCLDKDLERMQMILALPALDSIQGLVDRGEFINLGKKVMFKRKDGLEAPKVEPGGKVEPGVKLESGSDVPKVSRENVKAHLYKSLSQELEAWVRPDTYEVLSEVNERFAGLLKLESMRELVEQGMFKFEREGSFETATTAANATEAKKPVFKEETDEETAPLDEPSKSLRDFRFKRGEKRGNNDDESSEKTEAPALKKIKILARPSLDSIQGDEEKSTIKQETESNDEFDDDGMGYVSELSSSEVDSDDEMGYSTDDDISEVKHKDDSDDSDYYASAADKAEAKRRKMRATRAERSAKKAMMSAAAGSSRSNLGDHVAALLKAMSKREKLNDGVERLAFNKSALKEDVNEASIDTAMPVLLGLGIVQRQVADCDTSSPKDFWNGFFVERITEVLASILDANDDVEESDHRIWALSKKVLSIFLKLPVGQGLHSIETFIQLHGEEAAHSIDKAGDYGDFSTVLRILSVSAIDTLVVI